VTITSLVISDDVLHRATCVCGPGYAQGDNLAQRGIPKTPRKLTGDTCIRFRFPSERTAIMSRRQPRRFAATRNDVE
jgi:hypothetical protein